MKKIIFVCHGNICRSPMAEFIFRHLAAEAGLSAEFEVSSAAVSYEEQGNGIYPPAAQTLRRHGIPFGNHRAHRITPQEFASADLVVVMDSSNQRLLDRLTQQPDSTKVRKMMQFTGISDDVADPWYTGDFEQTYSDLFAACSAMLEKITRHRHPAGHGGVS